MTKNIILLSLRESFSSILKSKLWFLALIIVQLVFFAAVFMASNKFLIPMLENAQAMSQYISSSNLDEASMTKRVLEQKDILGDDPAAITRYFDGVIKNFRQFLIYLFALALVFSSILWTVSHRTFSMENLSFKNLRSNFIILLFYLGLIFLFFYLSLNITFSEAALQGSRIFVKYAPLLIFSIALAYFMFISLALSNKRDIKQVMQKTLTVGIKKAHYILAVYFINGLLFILFIFLMAYFIDKNFFIIILSFILFIFSFVFARIFIVSVVKRIE